MATKAPDRTWRKRVKECRMTSQARRKHNSACNSAKFGNVLGLVSWQAGSADFPLESRIYCCIWKTNPLGEFQANDMIRTSRENTLAYECWTILWTLSRKKCSWAVLRTVIISVTLASVPSESDQVSVSASDASNTSVIAFGFTRVPIAANGNIPMDIENSLLTAGMRHELALQERRGNRASCSANQPIAKRQNSMKSAARFVNHFSDLKLCWSLDCDSIFAIANSLYQRSFERCESVANYFGQDDVLTNSTLYIRREKSAASHNSTFVEVEIPFKATIQEISSSVRYSPSPIICMTLGDRMLFLDGEHNSRTDWSFSLNAKSWTYSFNRSCISW